MMNQLILPGRDLNLLFNALKEHSYSLMGPTIRDGAMVYDQLNTANDLPIEPID